MIASDNEHGDLLTKTIHRSSVEKDSTADRPIAGRYQLLERLGAGGMATVHRARDLQKDCDVAIKFMKTELGGAARRRFLREFNTIAGIKHPCCLSVYEIGETEDAPYFTMELHPGQTLSAVMGRPAEEVARLLIDLTLAIDYIHSQGIVHRDIKPSNVMVQQSSENGRPIFRAKLADFGLAKFYHLDSSLTGEKGLVGTPPYCAPEQIESRRIDHRADLYNLGILAFELLSGGNHPFAEARSRGINAILHAQLSVTQDPLNFLNPKIPESLSNIVDQYLAKDAENRPPSAHSLRRILSEVYSIEVEQSLEKISTPDDVQINTFGFVCRKSELEQIDNYLQTVSRKDQLDRNQDAFGALIFTGDPGIGKSSIVEEASRKALSLGFRIYEGRCFDGDISSFHPFVSIIRQIFSGLRQTSAISEQTTMFAPETLGSNDKAKIDQILLSYRQELLRVAPELRRFLPGEDLPMPAAGDGQYIYRALTSMFIELSQFRSICICLDDIQWADQSSLTLLKHITVALSSAIGQKQSDDKLARLAIFCTGRSGYPALAEFLRREQVQSQLHCLELKPFDYGETKLLTSLRLGCHAGQIDEDLIHSLDTVCRGNPFFISETVREWQSRGRIVRQNETWKLDNDTLDDSSLPSTVRSSLGARLSELSETAKTLLSAAAVIGRVVDLDLLSQVLSNVPEHAVLDGVDELLSKRIFIESNTASRVEFGHDLLRELALSELSANRRRSLHRSVAASLESKSKQERSNSPAATLAMHYLAGEQYQDALKYLLAAANEAIQAGAYENALQYLTTIEHELPNEILAGQNLTELNNKSCVVNLALKRLEAAEHYARKSVEIATDNGTRGQWLSELAWIKQQSGKIKEAGEIYDQALTNLGFHRRRSLLGMLASIAFNSFCFQCVPGKTLRRFYNLDDNEMLSILLMLLSHYEYIAAPRTTVKALQLYTLEAVVGKFTRSPHSKALSLSIIAFIFCNSGFNYFGLKYVMHGISLLQKSEKNLIYAYAKCKFAMSLYCAGKLEKAHREIEDSIEDLRHSRDHFTGQAYHWLRHVYSVCGLSNEILRIGNSELMVAEATGDDDCLGYAHYGLSHGFALKGAIEPAIEHADRSFRYLSNNGNRLTCIALMERGFARLQQSDYESAIKNLSEGVATVTSNRLYWEIAIPLFPRLLEARLGPKWNLGKSSELVDPQGVNRYLWRTRLFAMMFPNVRPHILRVLGRYSFAKGKTKKARKLFERSVEAAEKLGARFDHARALDDLGRAFPEFKENRVRARQILKEIGAVMPEAECNDYDGPSFTEDSDTSPTVSLPGLANA